jgi:hypothetical protein
MPTTVLILGVRVRRAQLDANAFGVPIVGRDELVAVAAMVVIHDEADRTHSQQEDDCRCHGTNYALVDIPPTVAALTLHNKILPARVAACYGPSPSS